MIVKKCPSLFQFYVRPDIHYRVQIWTLTRPKHELDGLVLKTLLGCLLAWRIVLLKNIIYNLR